MDGEFPKAAFSPEHRPGLEALSKAGTDAALFGGQAVYFWADRYLAKHPELVDLGPFTSKDTDALIVDAKMLDRLKPWGKVIRSTSPADGQLAIFTPKGKDSAPVDLFTTVYGFSASRSQALIAESQPLHGSLRVLHPVDLLIAKAYNIRPLTQFPSLHVADGGDKVEAQAETPPTISVSLRQNSENLERPDDMLHANPRG